MQAFKAFIILSFLLASATASAQWKPAGQRIASRWAAGVRPENAWREYPRPQLVRSSWLNLNGLWDYAITGRGASKPEQWSGNILVPYAIESSLSGVGTALQPNQYLWYRRRLRLPEDWAGKRLLLHFGAVDYQCTVYINGSQAGVHTGSADPFTFDISPWLTAGEQEIILKVSDPTDSDIQPRGKQSLRPEGFWYTAVSGIWQTVWVEPVSQTHVTAFLPEADIDRSVISFHTHVANLQGNEFFDIKIYFKDKLIQSRSVAYQPRLSISLKNAHLWRPADPALYQVTATLKRRERVLDTFRSYFAMRKISLGPDQAGQVRILLNNQAIFQWGVLDQGWWPESLLTPPSDEALRYDMQVIKALGFNLIRKHIKVEPSRFYYHADQMGLLVWQDMPSGFLGLHHPEQHVKFDAAKDWERPSLSAALYEAEWKAIIDNLRFFSSIVAWVPFNEGWGQYDTERIARWTKSYDSTRLVNAASGWTDRNIGDMYDAHQYPGPSMEPGSQNPGRALVLGEFGGLGWPLSGHLWDARKKNWGYRNFASQADFTKAYASVIKNVYPLIARGLSAAIYTQTSDVEAEVNGLLTYDRKVLKLDTGLAASLHADLFKSYAAPVWLVRDGEEAPAQMRLSREQPAAGWLTAGTEASLFRAEQAPVKLLKGQRIWSVADFDSRPGQRPAMKIYAQGHLKIFLNGMLVCDKTILTKRHYDELNLGDYSHLLRAGKNRLAVVLTDVTADSAFDYGLYSFSLSNDKPQSN
ncbi:glycoside hydrolase family 2 protein [Pedobacter yulinensis]|nr:sugar-binding domain-containing protein [Pedobacter yulinensis]